MKPVVEYLIGKNPNTQARLIVGDKKVGANPKVNNMVRGYDQALFDWILISDSNVEVDPDYLKNLMEQTDDKTGILTATVRGSHPKEVGGYLEAVYLNTFYARCMVLTAFFGHPCVVGKSMLFRKSVADRFGGLKVLSQYLAEDYMAGQAMLKLGYEVKLMQQPIRQNIGRYGFVDFWNRHIRWGRLRKVQALPAFILEPFFGMFTSGLIGAYAFSHWQKNTFTTFFSLHFCIWLLCDLLVMQRIGVRLNLKCLGAWLLREILCLPHWIHIALGNTVLWRGQKLRLQHGGILDQPFDRLRVNLNLQSIKEISSWRKIRQNYLSYGALQRAVIRSKAIMMQTIGGIGRIRGI